MDRPGRYQESSFSRRERRYSDEKYELTNTGRHFKTFTQLHDSGSNSDVNHSSLPPATLHREVQYYNTSNNQFTNSRDDAEAFPGNHEELDPKTMEFDRLVELMHPNFLSDYLGRILTFLKTSTKEICFPNIAPFKEAFLVKLVTDTNNLYSGCFNSICRSLCRDIIDVLESNRNVFRWIHAYESGMISKSVLVYQKMFLNRKQDVRESSVFKVPQNIPNDRLTRGNSTIDLDDEVDYDRTNQESCSSQPEQDDDESPSPGGNLSKRQRNYKALFDSVTTSFIMSALHTVVDFVEDETRTSLQFPDMDSEQARFLKSLNAFPFRRALYSLLGAGCAALVSRLRQGQAHGRLRVAEGRARRRDKLRDVTIKKKPPKGAKKSRDRMKGGQVRSNASSRSSSRLAARRQADCTPRDLFLKALSVSDDSDDSTDVTDKLDSVRSQESDVRVSAASKNRRTSDDWKRGNNARYSSTGIDWQPADEAGAAPAPVVERGRRVVRGKLAAALSVPVEADKAVRMMKLMGWEGGALGARGDGITEPIMPAIDIVSGAGLGHSPSRKKRERRGDSRRDNRRDTRTSAHFRRDLLDAILALTRRQDLNLKEIAFQDPLCKKARAFTRLLVEAFNARKNVGLNADEEKELVCRILSNLNCHTRLALEAKISDDWRLVTITKKTSSQSLATPSSRRKRKKGVSTVTEPEETEDDGADSRLLELTDSGDAVTTADIDHLLKKLGKPKSTSKKSQVALAYRIIFLKKLLGFVNSKQEEQTISFQEVLNSRQCKFVENMTVMINKREKACYSTKTENDLYADIKKNVDCYLKVKFTDSFRRINLQKKYYTKRFVNTSMFGSGATHDKETAESCNNNNDKDYKKCPDDHDDDEEPPDEDYEKIIEDMVVLSDSDDSIISLACDYNVLVEGDERKEKGDVKTDKKDNDMKQIDETICAEPKDVELLDWNASSEDAAITVDSKIMVTKCGDAAAETIVIVDPTEIKDETLLKRYRNVTRSNSNKVIHNVTDITSEIVLSDNVSSDTSKGDDYDTNDEENQQIYTSDALSDVSDRNKSLNPNGGQNVNEAISNEELDKQIKNLDTLKLENSIAVETDVMSLAIENKNELSHEETVLLNNGVEISKMKIVTDENHEGIVANGGGLIDTSIIDAESSLIKRNLTSSFDSNTVIMNNGEAQVCNIDNDKPDHIKAQELNDKGEYVSDLSPSFSKRSRTESENSESQVSKKAKIQLDEDKKFIAIVSCSPGMEINTQMAARIQENMLKTLEETSERPKLECNGIIDGKLLYKCCDENALQWLETFALKLQIEDSTFKLIDSCEDAIRKRDNKFKMAAKINSFLRENARDVFKRIESYNSGIKTEDWVVLSEQSIEEHYVFTLEVDYDSYKSLERCNFSLYAAIDCVQFSRIWV